MRPSQKWVNPARTATASEAVLARQARYCTTGRWLRASRAAAAPTARASPRPRARGWVSTRRWPASHAMYPGRRRLAGTGIEVAERGQAAGPAFRHLCRRRLGVQAGEQPQVRGSQGAHREAGYGGQAARGGIPVPGGPENPAGLRPGSAARRLASSTPAPWASSCRLRKTGKVAAGPYTTGAAAPGTVSTPR